MGFCSYRQSPDADFWNDFSAELAAIADEKPLTGAERTALAELDALAAADTELAEIERQLDALALSPEPGEAAEPAVTPRRQTLLERLNMAGNFASVSAGKIASKPEPRNSQKAHAARASSDRGESVCLVRPLTPTQTVRPLTPTQTPLPSPPVTHPYSTFPKSWKKASPEQKLTASILTAGHGSHAFTLNLSGKQEAALRASDDPARHMSNRINRAFKAAGIDAPAYSFALEVSPVGRVHVHGAIVLPAYADPHKVKGALMSAGGKIKGRAAARQVLIRCLDDPAGWAGYVQKDLKATRKALGTDKLTFISTALKRRCRSLKP
ncbi:MAG: hypothetical protein RLO08_13110 [Parvibaculaceae bacterium]